MKTKMKKISESLRLCINDKYNVAYGEYKGYFMTLSESAPQKTIQINAVFDNEDNTNAMLGALNEAQKKSYFSIVSANINQLGINVVLSCKYERIPEFLDWITEAMAQMNIKGADYCIHCGQNFVGGDQTKKLIHGTVYKMHSGCAQSVTAQFDEIRAVNKAEKKNIGRGTVGAVLGAVIGAIPWAILYALGYFASAAGLLIGWLSKKGYELLGGKNCKSKAFIIILTAIFGVFLGTFIGDVTLIMYDGIIEGYATSFADISSAILIEIYNLTNSSEYLIATLADVGLGLLFAGLGISDVIKDIFVQNRLDNPKAIDMF